MIASAAHPLNPSSALPLETVRRRHDSPPIGRSYEVVGRRSFLHRSGSGRPIIVYLPGGGMFGLGYYNIHTRVAELTTSVLYDRGGTGCGWESAAMCAPPEVERKP